MKQKNPDLENVLSPDLSSGSFFNRSALSSGLPDHDDIQERLNALSEEMHFVDVKEDSYFGNEHFYFEADNPVEYSADNHEQFLREFAHDLSEMQLRVQRIKLHALKHLLRGTYYVEEPEDYNYRWDEHLPQKQLWSLAYGLEEEEVISEESQRELVDRFNVLVSEENRLSFTPLLSKEDARLIRAIAGSMRYHQDFITSDERKKLSPILERVSELEKRLRDLKQSTLLFSMVEEDSPHEHKLRMLRGDYREILKDMAAYEESGSWFSPSYQSSMSPQRGKEQRSEPFRSDYQRFLMPEGEELERTLHKTFFRNTEYGERAKSLLFGGGISALQAIFRHIESDLSRARRFRDREWEPQIFKTEDIYFEVDALIEDFGKTHDIGVETFAPEDIDSLINRIKTDVPAVVFLNPMSNMYDMKIAQVSKLIKSLCDWEPDDEAARNKIFSKGRYSFRHLYLVVDNSTLGKISRWTEIDFRRLPDFVHIASFESLVKFGEDGLDLASAGLLTIIGEYADSDVARIRRNMGFMPPENTVRKLSFNLDSQTVDRKMARHSRNTEYLSRVVSEDAHEDQFIQKAIHPQLPDHPQQDVANEELTSAGGLFNIAINVASLRGYREQRVTNGHVFEEDSIQGSQFSAKAEIVAKAYVDLVTSLASAVSLELNQGTSYGFNTSRIAVYSRRIPKEVESEHDYQILPYIRVAPGTENIKDMILLAAVIKRANSVFTKALQEKRVVRFSEKLVKGELELQQS